MQPPSPFLDPGDRFIPTRSLMDIGRAQSCLIPLEKNPTRPSTHRSRNEYMKSVEENMRLNSEGRPYRMLEFRGSPRNSRKNRVGIEEEEEDSPGFRRKFRYLPKSAYRILDLPNLVNDYYLKLIDWGNNNILAVVLGNSIHLWHEATLKVEPLLTTDIEDYPTSVAWSNVRKGVLAIGFAGSRIEIWDVVAKCPIQVIYAHIGRVGTLSWNCNVLTSGSLDSSIINHDVRRLRPASFYRGHHGEVCGLQWSESGNQLASGGNDNLVHVWESSKSSKFLHRFSDHSAAVRAISWCPFKYNVMASGGGTTDRCIKFWNTNLGQCINSINTGSQVCALEWNRHQKEILSAHGYSHNQLSLWSYPSMSRIRDFSGYQGRVLHLSQNPDGSAVVTAATDETLRFWNIFGPNPSSSKSDESDSPLSLKRMHIR